MELNESDRNLLKKLDECDGFLKYDPFAAHRIAFYDPKVGMSEPEDEATFIRLRDNGFISRVNGPDQQHVSVPTKYKISEAGKAARLSQKG